SWRTARVRPPSPAAEAGPVPGLAVRAPAALPVAVTAVAVTAVAVPVVAVTAVAVTAVLAAAVVAAIVVAAAVLGPAAPEVAPGQDHQRDHHDGRDDVGRAMEGVDDGLPVLAHRV